MAQGLHGCAPMLYGYKCPKCGWEGDRLSSIAEADRQVCGVPIAEGAETVACDGVLVREEVPLTSRMSVQWAQWQGKGV
jgi:hypothetical protein